MKVRDLMTAPVFSCRPQDTLDSAAQRLWEHDCGVLPVLDGEGRVGATITDRDICMAAWLRGARLADLRVADSMSRHLVSCGVDDDVEVAAKRMAENQLHRLPVVDGDGVLCGILSLNDLAVAGERDAGVAKKALRVLTSVCRHRAGTAPTADAPVEVPAAGKQRAGGAAQA